MRNQSDRVDGSVRTAETNALHERPQVCGGHVIEFILATICPKHIAERFDIFKRRYAF